MESKVNRQRELVAMLKAQAFRNQGEVVQAMRDLGYEVTQPSISRDFRELGVVKLGGRYVPAGRQLHELDANGGQVNAFTLVRSVKTAGPNLVVIVTGAGAAPVVAAAIDRHAPDEIVGTIAGDDTVFVATTSVRGQSSIVNYIQDQAQTVPQAA